MKNSYKRFMEKVEVDEAMEDRILKKIHEEPEEIVVDKRLLLFRKLAPVAICLCLILGVFAHRVSIRDNGGDGNIGVINPIMEYSSLDKLKKALKFKVYVPDSNLINYEEISYFLLEGKTVEIRYKGSDNLTYRMRKGNEDISGDYMTYPYVYDIDVNGFKGKIKGTEDGIKLAEIKKKGYTFAISSENGLEKEAIIQIIESIK